jgi:hypothetical protein
MTSERLNPGTVKNHTRPRMVQALLASLFLTLAIGTSNSEAASANKTDIAKLKERVMHARAFETVMWSVPLMNYKAMRDGYKKGAGVGYNDVAYHSKVQTWELEIPTGNNTTPYVIAYWTVKDGPVVIEIPGSAKDVTLFGVMMDSWQRPVAEVGPAGADGGRGGKYLLLPPNYQGDLPLGYLVAHQKTYEGYFLLRPVIADTSESNLKKAEQFVKQIKIYPLAKAKKPPKTKHVDGYRKRVHAIMDFDASYFNSLHEILQQEYIEEKDLAILGLTESIGIRRGEPFKPNTATRKVLDSAAKEAHQYLIKLFFDERGPMFYDDRQWFTLNFPGTVETEFGYTYPTFVDLDTRAALYYGIFSSVERLGAGTFYFVNVKDASGAWLDGGKNYKLTVPANVPAKQFWSVIVHDVETAAWFTDLPINKEGVASFTKGLKKNQDGSVDVYFGPKAPKGKETNWLPTVSGKKFFLIFRFYGPEPALFNKSWKLSDVEKLK